MHVLNEIGSKLVCGCAIPMETKTFPDIHKSVVPDMTSPVTIVPEDLEIRPEVSCQYDGCNRVFKNASALQMHLVKKHSLSGPIRYSPRRNPITGRFMKENNSKKQFFCPIDTCCRGKNSGRPFNKMGNVKQHFHSVHSEKKFVCGKCGKKFGLSDVCKRHEIECGLTFPCICGETFNNKASLLSHTRRSNHQVPRTLVREWTSANHQGKTVLAPQIKLIRPVIICVGAAPSVNSFTVGTQTAVCGVHDPTPSAPLFCTATLHKASCQIECQDSGNLNTGSLTETLNTDSLKVPVECGIPQTTNAVSLNGPVVCEAEATQTGESWKNEAISLTDIGIQTLSDCDDCDPLEDFMLSSVGSQTDITLNHLFGEDLSPFDGSDSVYAVSTQTQTVMETGDFGMGCQTNGMSSVSTQTISEILATLENDC